MATICKRLHVVANDNSDPDSMETTMSKTVIPTESDQNWWENAVGYEIYVRSYADSNGDGIGDLAGIEAKLGYLKWLGVDAVWITPFYTSPSLDHGYDVADYCDVDPRHGSLKDFDRLIASAHELGLRVVVDLVPNHSSSAHAWFQDALTSTDSEFRDFYIWKDPAPDGGPPNNWLSHFGGPAWTLDEASNQYYCHLFLPEQPDLNWTNPAVRKAIDDVFVFWCERGVDGFRLDVAHGLSKHPEFPDNPQLRPLTPEMGPTERFESFEHKFDLDQDDNAAIYERWNRLVRPYGAMLLGEVNAPSADRIARFSEGDRLHRSFFLRPGWTSWDPEALLCMLKSTHDASPDGIGWVLNNHDQARSVSRFGGGDEGLGRSKALTTLLFQLGGIPFLYQGEELGLDNSQIEAGERTDPVWTRNDSSEVGRDVTRGPMPWTADEHGGFTTGIPWLVETKRPLSQTVANQRDSISSSLHWYRALISQHKAHGVEPVEPLEWLETGSDAALALRRGEVYTITNLGSSPLTLNLGTSLDIAFTSAGSAKDLDGASMQGTSATVSPEVTAVFTQSLR